MKDNYLIASPEGPVFLTNDDEADMYSFNGTPIRKQEYVALWPKVNRRPVPCLFAWQHAPGVCGPHYIVAIIFPQQGRCFTAGGSITVIDNWCEDHGATWSRASAVLYATRNAARAAAEVEW